MPNPLEITLSSQISNAAAQTTLSLEEAITNMKVSGMADSAIRQSLLSDLNSGGPIFGSFRNKVKNTVKNGVEFSSNQSSKGVFVKAGVERFQWVTVGDGKVCPDCDERHGETGTMEFFELLGLPGSGFSVCGPNCRCKVIPANYKGENLDKPLVKEKRITSALKKSILLKYQDDLSSFNSLPNSDVSKRWVMNKVNEGITEHSELYRGMALKNKDVDDFIDNLKSGDFVFPQNHNIQSFTADLELAENYSRWRRSELSPYPSNNKQIVMVFTSKQGKTLRGLDINKTAKNDLYESQLETIIGGNNKYKFIGSDETSDGIIFIQMEQL